MFNPIKATPRLAAFRDLNRLTLNEQRVYAYFQEKISYTRVPVNVPLFFIKRKLHLSYNTVWKTVKKLVEYGLIDKWTCKILKNNEPRKVTYYRLKQDLTGGSSAGRPVDNS